MSWRQRWNEAINFFKQGVFEVELTPLPWWQRRFWQSAQVASLAVRDFYADRCLLRASALTYTTLLSLVPLLALMFSLLKGLGVQNVLEPIILEHLAAGSERIVGEILRYIANTNVGRLGMAGLVFLVVTVLTLISNIEESFNYIWGVKETRSLVRRFSDYFSVLVFGPIFVVVAISMTSTLESQGFALKLMDMALIGFLIYLLFWILPYLAMWAAFTFLYIFLPNAKVKFRAALIGGIVGGTLWQVTQFVYVNFQVGVSRYNAIYGTMAALPVFMVWLYVSWLIVLLGLEVAFSSQNLGNRQLQVRGDGVNFASRELIALTIMLVVAEAFQRGEEPWGVERLSRDLGMPARLAKNVTGELARLGFLAEIQTPAEQDNVFQPARPAETIPLHEVLEALKSEGISFTRMRPTPELRVIADLEDHLAAASRQSLNGMTLRDLVEKMGEKDADPASDAGEGEG